MTENSTPRGVQLADIALAASLLTRVPLPARWIVPERMAASVWAFPIVGAGLGAACGLLLALAVAIGVPDLVAAGLAVGAIVLLTGGLHEDGLADCADGLGGGADRARALEIMKDSRIGAFGTLALALSLIIRVAAIAAIAGSAPITALIVVGALARMPMALAMAYLPHAREDGLSRYVGTAPRAMALTALALAFAFGIAGFGALGAVLPLVALLGAAPLGALALRRLGGQTGDVLGGLQQCAEMALLIVLSAALT